MAHDIKQPVAAGHVRLHAAAVIVQLASVQSGPIKAWQAEAGHAQLGLLLLPAQRISAMPVYSLRVPLVLPSALPTI